MEWLRDLQPREIAQLITAVSTPVLAALVGACAAAYLAKRAAQQRLTMDAFYRLVKDVSDFRVALVANIAHADQWHIIAEIRHKMDNVNEQRVGEEERRGIDALREMRIAVSSIKADRLVLQKLFSRKCIDLNNGLTRLTAMADTFDPLKTGGTTPERDKYKDLKFDDLIEAIDDKMAVLWKLC